MKYLMLYVILGASMNLMAQAKPEVSASEPTKAPEALTPMEITALQTVFTQVQKDVQVLHEFEAEVAKNHPGYHVDERAGDLVKDVPPVVKEKPAPVEAKPEKK
jgi:hypothetical protein